MASVSIANLNRLQEEKSGGLSAGTPAAVEVETDRLRPAVRATAGGILAAACSRFLWYRARLSDF
ncbi:MAG TPA: hypothetical protein VGP72_15540 [Planctomycetota bacterium]